MKDLKERTKKFALNCIHLCDDLPKSILGRHIKGQLLRSGTSVAANYRAANLGQSKPSFIAKLSIVIEEADESEFWMEIIEENGLILGNKIKSLKQEAHELTSIFIQSRKTAQKRN